MIDMARFCDLKKWDQEKSNYNNQLDYNSNNSIEKHAKFLWGDNFKLYNYQVA